MDDFFGLFAVHGADKAIEAKTNQITFENFIALGMEKKILTYNEKDCNHSGVNKLKTNPNDGIVLRSSYDELYNYLVKTDFIKRKTKLISIFTGSAVYTVNKSKTLAELKTALKRENLPDVLKCFSIDAEKLHNLLQNYTYVATDEVKFYAKGGRGKRSSRRCRRKRRKTRKYNLII